MTSRSTPSVVVLDEPLLEFGLGQRVVSPHDGLTLFGPFEQNQPTHPASPSYIVLGAPEGISLFEQWSRAMSMPASEARTGAKNTHILWPPYPGFEAAFASKWSERPVKAFAIDREALITASRKKDPHERCFAVVDLYLEALERRKKLDTSVSVAVCVVPEEVHTNCRPESRVAKPSDSGISAEEKDSRRRGQGNLFIDFDRDQYFMSPDFRRQLKARSMAHKIPIQIIRESTLRLTDEVPFGERRLTPLSDRMWNLSTALYY